jgi:hypothetical protein
MNERDRELAIELVKYLVRHKVRGSHNKQMDTVVNRAAIPTHDHGRASEVLEELVRDPPPVEQYGGTRNCVRLTSIQDGVAFIEEYGGDPPWNV